MTQNISIENRIRFLIILAGLLFFLPFNGLVHLFDWDEINFAESAREMIMTGDYSTVRINFVPFWEKPPLYIWMQVLSMKLFGVNEFAARFPNVICGIASLLVLFEIGKTLKNYTFGMVWALSYGAAVLPFLYFKSGIIDPWFNLFIFSSLHFAFKHIVQREEKRRGFQNIALSAIILGLAVLTKGPVAILLFGVSLLLFMWADRKFSILRIADVALFSLLLFLTGGAYHIYQLMIGNWQLVYDFFIYQVRLMKTEDAGHGGSIIYHPVVLLIGVFPTSILALKALFRKSETNNSYRKLMVILFWVVLVIFSLIKTKIVHYSSLCYFPLSYLAAISVYDIYTNNAKIGKWGKTAIVSIGLLYALAPGLIQLVATGISPEVLSQYIKDDFAIACLSTPVIWSGYEFLVGLAFAAVLIFSVYYLHGHKQIIALYFGTAVFIFMFMLVVVPRIEKYSQGPAIEFITEFKDQPVWVSTLDYKSYAPYFYSNKTRRAIAEGNEPEFLLNGDTNREVYFVVKVTAMQAVLDKNPHLELVKKKGGFALLERTDILDKK